MKDKIKINKELFDGYLATAIAKCKDCKVVEIISDEGLRQISTDYCDKCAKLLVI